MLLLGPLLNLPNPMAITSAKEFQQELAGYIEKVEEKLMQPMDKLIEEINSQNKMSPELEGKYYEKVFQQEVQEQMGHDLVNDDKEPPKDKDKGHDKEMER
jgi:hypothetical protein